MSLEAAILENTATLRELIARLTSSAAPVASILVTETKVAENTTNSPAETTQLAAESVTAIPASDAPQVSYEDVKKHILELSKSQGREAATAALWKFGVTKGPDLKPEQFADFVAHTKELLGA